MVCVNLRAVACHSFCHSPYVGIASAQELIPQHGRSAKFGVIPSESAHVISPFISRTVVCMHHIAVVEEPIPGVSLYLISVKRHDAIERAFYKRVTRRLHRWQRPCAEGSLAMQVFGCAAESLLVHFVIFSVISTPDEYSACPANAPGCRESRLHILVCCFEGVGNSVVVLKAVRFSFRGIETDGDDSCVAACIIYLQRRRVALPEIFQSEGNT